MSVLKGVKKAFERTMLGEYKPYRFGDDTWAARMKADKKIKKATPYTLKDAEQRVAQIRSAIFNLNELIAAAEEEDSDEYLYEFTEDTDEKLHQTSLNIEADYGDGRYSVLQVSFKKTKGDLGVLVLSDCPDSLHEHTSGFQLLLSKKATPVFDTLFYGIKHHYYDLNEKEERIVSKIKTDLDLD